MKILAAILFALMLAATYAGGPVANDDGEESICCAVCSCCVEESSQPVSEQRPSPAQPQNAGSLKLFLPRLVAVTLFILPETPASPPFSEVSELLPAFPIFQRDCALLI